MKTYSSKLVPGVSGIADAIGVSHRQMQTFIRKGLVSYIKAGHRTLLFDPEKTRAELNRLMVKAVGTK